MRAKLEKTWGPQSLKNIKWKQKQKQVNQTR